jgi:hypothetical protein
LTLEQTKYLSNLTTYSHKCNRISDCRSLNFYCEVLEIHTREAGYYTITSNSTIDIVGYVYESDFILFDLNLNAIKLDDSSHYNDQFKIILRRQMNTSFILIVTTNNKSNQGVFSITVNGPSNVLMRRISMCGFSFLIYENSHFIENER